MEGFRQEVKYIPLDQLDTTPRYQRVRESGSLAIQVEEMAANFKAVLCQIPDVYEKNGAGKYPVVDGAGRIGALRLMGVHGTHCRVLPLEKDRVQSQNFVRLNKNRKRVGPVDEFIAESFDHVTLAIKAILREMGLAEVAPNGRESYPKLAGGIDTLRAIYNMQRGDDRLRRSLRLALVWSKNRRISGVMLQTVLLLVVGQADLEKKIAATLEKHSFVETRKAVFEKYGQLKSKHAPPRFAEYIANKHNARRSEHRLDVDQIDRVQAEFLSKTTTR